MNPYDLAGVARAARLRRDRRVFAELLALWPRRGAVMEKTVTYCDLCGKPDAHGFSFAVDTEMDGAGDRDTIHKRVDLCPKCSTAQLELFIDSLPWPARRKLADMILKDKKLYLSHLSRTERFRGGAGEAV